MLSDSRYTDIMKKLLLTALALLLLCFIFRLVLFSTLKAEQKAANQVVGFTQDPTEGITTQNVTESDDESGNASKTSSTQQSTEEPLLSHILKESDDAGPEYIDNIVFLGDSTTYGLAYYDIIPKNQIWTGKNGTLSLYLTINETLIYFPDDDKEITIAEAASRKKPEYLVITLGLNGGVGDYFEERQFKASYKKLLDSIIAASPDTKIILQNIYPVAANIDTAKYKKINNENIDTANRWVLELAAEYGLKYLNSQECLRGIDGYMPLSYQNGDGIHLTPEALRTLIRYIRTHAYIG